MDFEQYRKQITEAGRMKDFNMVVLRFKYINTNGDSKFSVVQSNTGKRCFVKYNYHVSDTAEDILDRLGVHYAQIIDNTAKRSVDYIILSVNARIGIQDYIDQIKNFR